jgi:hypothetical protein
MVLVRRILNECLRLVERRMVAKRVGIRVMVHVGLERLFRLKAEMMREVTRPCHVMAISRWALTRPAHYRKPCLDFLPKLQTLICVRLQ